MSIPGCKKFPVDEKIETFQKLPVIKNYYLVLGGGKIGTDFLQYARKNNFPFVLVIDSDENAPASKEAQVLETESELLSLLRKKTELPLRKPDMVHGQGRKAKEKMIYRKPGNQRHTSIKWTFTEFLSSSAQAFPNILFLQFPFMQLHICLQIS